MPVVDIAVALFSLYRSALSTWRVLLWGCSSGTVQTPSVDGEAVEIPIMLLLL